MRFARLLLLAGLGLIGIACDRPAPPPPDAPPPPPPKKDLPPTTQQILEGPRKPTTLGLLPFTIDAPPGWSVQNHGEPGQPTLTMLEGPMIGGDAHVMLRVRDNQPPERMKALIDRIRRDGPAIEKNGGSLSVRDLGDVRVVERRELPRKIAVPTTIASEGFERPIEWRITLFVPAGVNYEQYEMQFIDLSPAAYEANAKLLNGLIASLKYQDPTRPPF